MNYKVSIIIPVYGVEQYIERCARSLFEQTYDNIEYVFVDDCSQDRSVEVLKTVIEDYPARKGNVKIIRHDVNRWLSAARNTGLKNSSGDYVYFVDSDDYIHCRTIELLVQVSTTEQADIVVGNYLFTNSSDEDTFRSLETNAVQTVPVETVVFEMLAFTDLKWCTAWNKLYKRSLIEGVLFTEEAYSIEDQDFNIRVYQKIEKVIFVSQCLYFYFNNPNSIVRNPNTIAKHFYFNTMYRFKMLDYIRPGENYGKYRIWIMYYGYRQILNRMEVINDSEYSEKYRQMVHDIWRNTRREYLLNDEITTRMKFHFVFYWFFPQLSHLYVRFCKKKKR